MCAYPIDTRSVWSRPFPLRARRREGRRVSELARLDLDSDPASYVQYEKRWAVWLLPVYGGLVFATVFGRFHYVVDVLAGWTLAFMIVGSYRLNERLR